MLGKVYWNIDVASQRNTTYLLDFLVRGKKLKLNSKFFLVCGFYGRSLIFL